MDDFSLSPDGVLAAVLATNSSAQSRYSISIVDTETGTVLRNDLYASDTHLRWLDNRRFEFEVYEKNLHTNVTYEFDAQKPTEAMKSRTIPVPFRSEDWQVHFYGGAAVLQSRTGQKIDLSALQFAGRSPRDTMIGCTERWAFLKTLGPRGFPQIVRVDLFNKTAHLVVPEMGVMYATVSIDSDALFIHAHLGASERLFVYNFFGFFRANVEIPSGCSMTSAEWERPGETINIYLTSVLEPATRFVYDIKTESFEEGNPVEYMMSLNGVLYKHQIVSVLSADGTAVPVRMIYRSALKQNRSRAVLIKSYGAFGSIDEFYPNYTPDVIPFLENGGIYVTPAVRGGGELGPAWHQAGAREGKKKTMEDLYATAGYFINNNYATANHILAMGVSNGALLTAATALHQDLGPSPFGLIIAINGNHDILNAAVLDADKAAYWATENGDGRKTTTQAWVRSWSPVEQAREVTAAPHIMILVGERDPIVNPGNSYRLAYRLWENPHLVPQQIDLLSFEHGEHSQFTTTYNQPHSMQSQVAIWTRVFDYLGWSFHYNPHSEALPSRAH
jgi:prolyl oligopeptidase PreP (S9A serine peptidase family)